MATTRKNVRRAVLRALGDIRICTATADGTDQTFVDQIRLTGGLNAYQGRDVLFTGGTAANLGEQRYVISSSSSNRNVAFGLPLPADTALGDELELVNTKGLGFKFDDVHEVINDGIRGLGLDGLVSDDPAASTYAYGTAVTLPPNWRTVEGVKRRDSDDTARWHSIAFAPRPHGNGWWVDRATRSLYVTGPIGARLDGAAFEVWGMIDRPELLDDADETDLPEDWLVAETVARLARSRHMRSADTTVERMVYAMSQNAAALRPGAVTVRSAYSVLL